MPAPMSPDAGRSPVPGIHPVHRPTHDYVSCQSQPEGHSTAEKSPGPGACLRTVSPQLSAVIGTPLPIAKLVLIWDVPSRAH